MCLNPLQLGRNSDKVAAKDFAIFEKVSIPYNWGVIQTLKYGDNPFKYRGLNPLQLGRNSDRKLHLK